MREKETELQFESDSGERIHVSGQGLGEPEKAKVLERAEQIAASRGSDEKPQQDDFEQAARDLAASFQDQAVDSDRAEKPESEIRH